MVERIDEMTKLINKIIFEFSIQKVYMEEIQLQMGNVKAYKTLAYLQGILINLLYNKQIPYALISSVTWKSKCGIKGKKRIEQKQNAINFVKEKYGIEVSTDIADAICIGLSQIL